MAMSCAPRLVAACGYNGCYVPVGLLCWSYCFSATQQLCSCRSLIVERARSVALSQGVQAAVRGCYRMRPDRPLPEKRRIERKCLISGMNRLRINVCESNREQRKTMLKMNEGRRVRAPNTEDGKQQGSQLQTQLRPTTARFILCNCGRSTPWHLHWSYALHELEVLHACITF